MIVATTEKGTPASSIRGDAVHAPGSAILPKEAICDRARSFTRSGVCRAHNRGFPDVFASIDDPRLDKILSIERR
jgi:hypothetical protein